MATREAYQWRPGSRFRVPARVAGPEIRRIEKVVLSEGRELTPRDVVDAARSEDSPIHRLFEWDDTVAADRWRLHQARQVLRCIEIRQVDPRDKAETMAPIYVHATQPGTDQPIYAETRRLLTDDELQEAALDEAARLLEGVRTRFARLKQLSTLFREIDAFLAERNAARAAKRKKAAAKAKTP